jgi:hypothetical protein
VYCSNGTCGSINGRNYAFEFGAYAAPLLDATASCFDDIFGACDDPPDLVIDATIEGSTYGPFFATDTPVAGTDGWYGNFGFPVFQAPILGARTFNFVWADDDGGDPRDPIGNASGVMSEEMIRNRAFVVGRAGSNNSVTVYVTPQPI